MPIKISGGLKCDVTFALLRHNRRCPGSFAMKSKQGSIGPKRYFVTFGIAFVMAAIASVRSAVAGDDGAQITQFLPTGQRITPQAAAGAIFQDLDPKLPLYPDHRAGQAVTVL